jgi:TolA-binding protein
MAKIGLISILALTALTRPALSAMDPAKDENKAFVSARQAFDEQLFDVADQRFGSFLKKYPAASQAGEARLLEAQALYHLGHYPAALELLSSPEAVNSASQKAASIYWQGEALTALKRWPEAEAKFRDLITRYPQNENATEGRLQLAWCLLEQEKTKDADEILGKLSADPEAGETAQKAALILAKSNVNKGLFKEARDQLEVIVSRKPVPAIYYEASYLLGEINSLDNKFAEAIIAYAHVTESEKAFPKSLVGQVYFGLGRAYHRLNQQENALEALEKAWRLNDEEQLKLASFRLYLESAIASQRLPEAIEKLQEFAKNNADKPNAAGALFAIALAQKDSRQPENAIVTLQTLLTAYPKSRWRSPAEFELGQLNELAGKPDEALKALQSCLEGNESAEQSRAAELEIGKILFAQKDYTKAASQFARLIGTKDALAEDAMYNLLLSEARQNQLDVFLKTQEQFTATFPQSQYLDKVALLRGSLQEKLGQPAAAWSTYEKALLATQSNSQKAVLTLRLADLAMQSGNINEASLFYGQFQKQFPDDPAYPDAACKGIFADLATKKIAEEQAAPAMLALLEKFPKHPLAPQILFHLAEFYFNHQDYANAEIRFAQLAREYPQHALAGDALYWTGVCAAAHADYDSALSALEKVPETSPLKIDARLLQSKIFQRQLKFENAITLLDPVLAVEKSGPRFVEAMLRKGDCYFALGVKDPGNYEQAAAAYGVITNGNQGGLAQRNEAGFRRAKSLEKLGRGQDALALYLDVLYGRLAPTGPTLPPPPEFMWKIKAGLEAARMKEETQDWRGAIQIYRGLEQLGGPNQQEFRDVVNRIRRDHYLYE